MARPTIFDQETADVICERLMDGESLRGICENDELPSRSTVMRWLREKPAFQHQYAHARDTQADTLADEILEIADGLDPEGEIAGPRDHNRDRLRIDARKWLASKMAPKKYGEKVMTEITGPDGGAVQIDYNKLSKAQRDALREIAAASKA